MPFKVVKINDNEFKLYNLEKKVYVKRKFKTRKSANNMKKTYMNYSYGKNKK